jgi:hypothetical protein
MDAMDVKYVEDAWVPDVKQRFSGPRSAVRMRYIR